MKLKKTLGLMGMLILFLNPINDGFAQDITPNKFQYFKKIPQMGKGLSSIKLDAQVYDSAGHLVPDIRIFDQDGVEVPYHKYNGFSKENVETIDFRILNLSEDQEILRADFIRESSLVETYDQITIDIASRNFLLSPNLYGSTDGRDFFPIHTKGYIYSFDDINKGHNNIIAFDEVNYNYLRAEFEIAMGRVSPKDISKVSYTKNLPYIPMEKQIESDIVSLTQIEKTTEIVLDMHYTNLPLSAITINADGKNYYRVVKILTGDEIKKMNLIAEDVISSFDIGDYKVDNNKIKIDTTCQRYVKLIINNEDNASLKIGGIDFFYLPDTLVFETELDKTYSLYYGSKAYRAPIYDISYIAAHIDEKTLQESQLGQENINQNYKKQDIPFTERNPYITTISIALAVGVLGLIVAKNLRDK
ncbi:MAG: hypothetical protein GX308_02865 [Epulopiscium sp.]|nr:hypothetical protein [Candidatus Epulonipiscium sp.]